jgi:hypothetical protein
VIYDHSNALSATVYDVDTCEKIVQVISIDTQAGEVLCAYFPTRVVDDDVETYTIRYRAIHPIFGGSPWPVLFHCYGRVE